MKNPRELVRMVLVLSVICTVAAASLAALKAATRDRIEEQVLVYVQGPALEEVFDGPDNNPIADRKAFSLDGGEITVFPAMKDERLAAVAMEAKAQGYGGDVGVMVGFDVDEGTVAGIAITSMKETPGVGTRVARHSFTSQFSGHPLTGISLRSQGGDIDAVSGATYSSIAAVQATAKAADWYRALEEEIKKTWPAG